MRHDAELVPISTLKPYGKNPRRGDVDAIRDSLRANGQYRPVVVRAKTREVLAGNHTLKAAIAEEWTELWATFIDVDAKTAKRIVLVDNRSNDLAGYDHGELVDLLGSLPSLEGTGYDQAALDDLIAQTVVLDDAGRDTEPGGVPAEPVTRPGDLIVLGDHRLVCGDSTDPLHVERATGDLTPTATITDPPYGIGFDYWDHDDDASANEQLVCDVFALAPGLRVWTPGKMNLARELAREPGAHIVCWHKGFARMGNGMGGASTWEPVLVTGDLKGARLVNDYLHVPTDRDEALTTEDGDLRHPCPKPVGLFEALIDAFTEPATVVYEPFCGSGSTLIAAQNLGRRCVALEKDPGYCDVIIDRYERHTGRTAERPDS